eukprot:TRINITY_DN1819_c0_g1_i1.p1 TRINITY_DN1819_c0_g1~~TRINITY_DN1819_c0_g1_i1.p1  ORF type:complete len:211 (+),score=47.52 TRINITY_DN1819_c0_g1_i1:342-974(+)
MSVTSPAEVLEEEKSQQESNQVEVPHRLRYDVPLPFSPPKPPSNDSLERVLKINPSLNPTPKKRSQYSKKIGGPKKRKLSNSSEWREKNVPQISASLTIGLFKKFTNNAKMSSGAKEAVLEASRKYWEQAFSALNDYSDHAGRSSIEESDLLVLFKRQRLVNDRKNVYDVTREHFPRELLGLVIPLPKPKEDFLEKKVDEGGGSGDPESV